MGAIYYLAAFYLRSSPGVMTSELMRSFGITATQLGGLAASYYYAYVLMQIPTGVLVDTLGPRKLLAGGAVLAAAGTLLFGVTTSFAIASAARALTGATTAVAWVVTLKLATHWFPSRMFALLSGFALFTGNLGAILAQVPLRLMIEHFEWRTVIISSAAGILFIGILGWIIVRNDPADRGYAGFAPTSFSADNRKTVWQLVRAFPTIFTFRNIWLIFLAQGGFVGSILAFTALWGPPYLRSRFGLTPASAAAVCTVMSVSWAVASPVFGYLSDKIGRRKPLYVTGAVLSCVGWAAMIYIPVLSLSFFLVLAALTSFASGAVIIGFAFAKESVPIRFLGSVTGVVNMGNMIGPTLLQPAIGWVLDRRWTGEMSGGLRVYSTGAFQTGFLVIIGWLLVTSLLLSLTRETNCNPTAD
jgi:sugar phosphate permease